MIPAEPKRLLIANWFSRTLELEGAGSLLLGLAGTLAKGGWEVRLLLPAGGYPALPGVRIRQYVGGIPGFRSYLRAVQMNSRDADAVLLFENNPNMGFVAKHSHHRDRTWCYFFTPLQPVSAAWRGGLSRQAVAHTLAKHGFWSKLQNWHARRCIVQTRYQAEQLRRLGVAETHVIPGCGISRGETIPTRKEARQVLGWDAQPVVGYLGHYSRAKGVDVLVEAMSRTSKGVLALAHSGKGRLTPAAATRLEALRAAGRVREVGVTKATTFLAACDVAVFPYITSSVHHLPQALMESHASATPVITTDVGGVSEGHREGETGWLVRPDDAEALVGALRVAFVNLDQCRAMGRSTRNLFESSWCIEVFSAAVGNLLLR